MSSAREDGHAAELRALASLARLDVSCVVGLHAIKELLAALGVLDVLDTDVNPLLDITVANNLVHDHTNCMGSDVVNNASAAMVVLVGHALLLCSIGLNIDNVANTVGNKVS